MASNLLASDGLQPRSDGLQAISDGLQPKSDGLLFPSSSSCLVQMGDAAAKLPSHSLCAHPVEQSMAFGALATSLENGRWPTEPKCATCMCPS